jgi:hypothetical protein
MESLADALKRVPDHRKRQGRRHELGPLLLFLCTGMLCGCGSLQALTQWGKRQERTLLETMGFPRGRAPGYGTLQRLVSRLDSQAFEQVLGEWSEGVLRQQAQKGYQAVALDGKTLRGSRQGELPGVQLLAAFAHHLGLVLEQQQVPATTNEYTVSLPLLRGLTLINRVVTADALFMQREVCHLVTERQGHYLIVLKDNQPDLKQAVEDWFEPFPPTG